MKKTILALALAAGLTSFSGSAKAAILDLRGALPYSTPSQTDYWGIAIAFDGTSFNFGRYALSVNNDWLIATPDSMDGFRAEGNRRNDNLIYTLTASPIAYGATIDSTLGYSSGTSYIMDSFSNAYFGLASQTESGFNYGWLEISYDSSAEDSTLVAGGMNTTLNESITAGQTSAVPEPSTYALFGFGALALVVAYRRKVA